MRGFVAGMAVAAGVVTAAACADTRAPFADVGADAADVVEMLDISLGDSVSDSDSPETILWRCIDPSEPCDALPPPGSDPDCGRVLREGGDFPERLSKLGCFAPGDPYTPAAGVIAYEVAAPLFSEGSVKGRFLSFPAGVAMEATAAGAWQMPDASLVLKTFGFPASPGSPVSPVEVRVMWHARNTWKFAAYLWSEALGDGVRVAPTGQRVAVTTHDARGLPETLSWWAPGITGCEGCHGYSRLDVLGMTTAQLAVPIVDGNTRTRQLVALHAAGWLATPPPATDAGLTLPGVNDPDASVAARARAWLHGNCTHCHQPGGFAPGDFRMDLRADRTLAEMAICDVRPKTEGLNRTMRILAPGDPARSLLLQRIVEPGPERMPPDGGSRIDAAGVALLEAWIAGMADCDE